MAALSDYLENKIVDSVLRGQVFPLPVTIHIALWTAATTDVAGVAGEVAVGAYARVPVTAALANFKSTQNDALASTGTGGATSNSVVVTFPTPTAGWGTVTHWAAYDALTAGNLLFQAPLTISKVINTGDAVSFAVGALTLTVA